MIKFKRENKYLVIKWDDIASLDHYHRVNLLDAMHAIEDNREAQGKDPFPTFVCIKDTYPEYEYVWKCIEERVTSKENKNSD